MYMYSFLMHQAKFVAQHFQFFHFSEKMSWHSMWIACQEDGSPEISRCIFFNNNNKKKFKMLLAAAMIGTLRVHTDIMKQTANRSYIAHVSLEDML